MDEGHNCEAENEELKAAIQKFANVHTDQAAIVDTAIVVWEEVTFSDDGEPGRRIQWAMPTDNFSLAAALGLARSADMYIEEELMGRTGDNDR